MKFYNFRAEKGRVGDKLKDFFFLYIFFLSSLDFYTALLLDFNFLPAA